MNAEELYKLISDTYPDIGEAAICDLHKPCAKSKRCAGTSRRRYIDFDKVETEFDRGKNTISCHQTLFLLVNLYFSGFLRRSALLWLLLPALPGDHTDPLTCFPCRFPCIHIIRSLENKPCAV